MKSGVNYGDYVDSELDEKVQSLEDIKYQLQRVIEVVKEGTGVQDYEYLIDQCEDWIDECDNDIKAVQDEIDEALKHAHSSDYDE